MSENNFQPSRIKKKEECYDIITALGKLEVEMAKVQ
jgi:hypothetical protein